MQILFVKRFQVFFPLNKEVKLSKSKQPGSKRRELDEEYENPKARRLRDDQRRFQNLDRAIKNGDFDKLEDFYELGR